MMKIYETDRLYLREIDESYAETVLQYYDRNREFLKAWEEYRPDDFFYARLSKEKVAKG